MLELQDIIDGKMLQKNKGKIKILSIDGGGIKGLFPAQYLARVEKSFDKKINACFDMIVGTSTGGIIALAVSIGIPCEEIVKLYQENAKEIFKANRWLFLKELGLFKSKYSNQGLKNALRDTFKEYIIKDANTLLCIPSIRHYAGSPKVFKTPHTDDILNDLDPVRPMWEVALATSAAPIYFPTAEINDNAQYIDGGLWANNPTVVGILEALKLGYNLKDIEVFSIGTGEGLYRAKQKKGRLGGALAWGKKIVELTMSVQTKSSENMVKYLIKDNCHRVNFTIDSSMKMDTVKKDDLNFLINAADKKFEDMYKNYKHYFQSREKCKGQKVESGRG